MALSKVDLANQVENDLPQNLIANNVPFRNIIINGDMSIAQRGTSASSITSSDFYTVDRWKTNIVSLGTWTQSQSTDVPTGQGFAKSTKLDCTTADASPSASDSLRIWTTFEGQNLQYLKKGTSSAESLTLSFWVKSNKTGTYIAELFDNNNTRNISKSYTIDSANTWEKKTLTFAGDTSGAFTNNNALSLYLMMWLGAGSTFTSGTLSTTWTSNTNANRAVGQVNLADSTDNEWYITGVQLEAGTTASDFEFLPFDINQRRCQRYYYRVNPTNISNAPIGTAIFYTSSSAFTQIPFPITMRASPTLEQVTGTNYFNVNRNADNDFFNSFETSNFGTESTTLYVSSGLSATSGDAGRTRFNNTSARVAFVSEL